MKSERSPRRKCVGAALVHGVLVLGVLTSMSELAWADNPIVQTNYTADPAPAVYDGTLYLYTTHDEDVTVNDFFTMNDWRVYSTTDAVNWTDHGSPLHYNDFSWAGGSAWAGQTAYRNGKYYFYVPVVRGNGGNAIGVGVADSPIGPFEDAIGAPLITSDCGDIDPTVFIDNDDQAYLYWGNPNLCYVRLNEDMVSYQGDVVRVPMNTASLGVRSDAERPVAYEEGPWFYERAGLYYLVFPGGPLPEHIAYATSPGPTGPWTYGSVIMPAEGGSFTNHPGVVDYKGKSLFFYHNGALPGGGGFKRSVSVEEFTYGADGKIPELRMSTEGATAVDVLNPFAQVEAETIAWEAGIETEDCSEGGLSVTSIDDGDYIKLKEVEFGAGATSFEARVAAGGGGGAIELRLDSEDGTLVGTCAVESTGGDEVWATQSCTVEGATGKHDLFLEFTAGGFKFNWWKFSGPGVPSSEGSGGQTAAGGSGGLEGTAGAESTGSGGASAAGGASGGGTSAGTGGLGGPSCTAEPPSMPPASQSTAAPVAPSSASSPPLTAPSQTNSPPPVNTSGPAVAPTQNVGNSPTPPATATSGGFGSGGSGNGGAPSPAVSSDTNSAANQSGCSCSTVGSPSKSGSISALVLLGLCLVNSRRVTARRAR